MPLSHHVGLVAELLELLGQGAVAEAQAGRLEGLEGALLPPDVEGVATGEEGGSRRGAHLGREREREDQRIGQNQARREGDSTIFCLRSIFSF